MMFGVKCKTEFNHHRIQKAADDATYRSLGHAAASVRKIARASIERAEGASAPGTPPHTHRRGRSIRTAILFAAEWDRAVVGTSFAILGEAGSPHERGGVFRGRTYDPRPFMAPALVEAAPRMPSHWANSVY